MIASLRITLPAPPSANAYWVVAKVGLRHIMVPSSVAKDYKKLVAELCRGRTPIAGRARMCVIATVHPSRDVGANVLKVLEDALNGIAWFDDNQLDHVCTDRAPTAAKLGAGTVGVQISGERFATEQEVRAFAQAKADRARLKRETAAAKKQAKFNQVEVVRLATSATYPARQR